MVAQELSSTPWVLLSYRVPREPSTPRIAVWRRLKDIGAVQVGDGLVALPASDHTREQLEWVANQVLEADGEAIVWTAAPTTKADTARLVAEQRLARDDEYAALLREFAAARPPVDRRTIARWRRELRKIERRDYFESEQRQPARQALTDLTGADEHEDVREPAQ